MYRIVLFLFVVSAMATTEEIPGEPRWAPDGKHIVYHAYDGAYTKCQIRLVSVADGSCKTLAPEKTWALQPSFSNDGKQIVFAANRSGAMKTEHGDLFIINPDGTGLRQITNTDGQVMMPSFSPDNKKIAFASNKTGKLQIYVMDANGGEATRVTPGDFPSYHPGWTPDGKKLIYASSNDKGNHVYSSHIDGSELKQLTPDSLGGYNGKLTADGKTLVYVVPTGKAETKSDIYLLKLDGSEPQPLISTADQDWAPSFSPDGKHLAYTSRYEQARRVYLLNTDTKASKSLAPCAK